MAMRLSWTPTGRATCSVFDDQTPMIDVGEAGQRRSLVVMPASTTRVSPDELEAARSLRDALVEFVRACEPWTGDAPKLATPVERAS